MVNHKTSPSSYFYTRWVDFQQGRYFPEVEEFERLTAMKVDQSRLPFICAGNLEDQQTPKMLTFGLAPHSNNEYVPESFEEYYQWRVHYFNTEKIPHRLHSYYGRMCYGMIESTPVSRLNARWLHTNGYLTFDLIPYYIKHWIAPSWNNEVIFRCVKNQFKNCLNLIEGHDIRFAIFSGKAWEELLVPDASPRQLCEFTMKHVFPLSNVTRKMTHRTQVYVGEMSLDNRRIRAVIIAHLIHQIWGLSYQHALDLGCHIRTLL